MCVCFISSSSLYLVDGYMNLLVLYWMNVLVNPAWCTTLYNIWQSHWIILQRKKHQIYLSVYMYKSPRKWDMEHFLTGKCDIIVKWHLFWFFLFIRLWILFCIHSFLILLCLLNDLFLLYFIDCFSFNIIIRWCNLYSVHKPCMLNQNEQKHKKNNHLICSGAVI